MNDEHKEYLSGKGLLTITEKEASLEILTAHQAGKRFIEVQVDIALAMDIDVLKGVSFKRKTKRGNDVYMTGFQRTTIGEKSILTFSVVEELHPSANSIYPKLNFIVGTTFSDFCWLVSDGTTNITALEVATPLRDKVELGDLTWCLPSKFADDLIEAMHSLNLHIVDGLLADAIIYGPFFS